MASDAAPLPEAALAPCADPADFLPAGEAPLTQAQVEVAFGRTGSALVRCGREKAALAAWARGVRADLGAR